MTKRDFQKQEYEAEANETIAAILYSIACNPPPRRERTAYFNRYAGLMAGASREVLEALLGLRTKLSGKAAVMLWELRLIIEKERSDR